MLDIGIIAALLSVLCWIGSQTIAKTVAPRLGVYKTTLLIMSAGLLPLILAYAYSPVQITFSIGLFSFFAGLALGLGYFFYYRSVKSQQISNVASIGLVQVVLVALFGILFLGEPLNAIEIIAAFMIVAGVLLISITKTMKFNKMLLPVFIANVFWAIYWILLSEAITVSGQVAMPVLIARAAATILAFAVYLPTRKSNSSNFNGLGLSVGIVAALGVLEGVFDGLGNLSFSYAIHFNVLAIASLLGTMIPVSIAVIAYFVYKERFTLLQAAGVLIAIIGAVAIALF